MNHHESRKSRRILGLTSVAVLGGAVLAAACSGSTFRPGGAKSTGDAGENTGGAETEGGSSGGTAGRGTGGTGGESTGGAPVVIDDGGADGATTGGAPGTDGGDRDGSAPECVQDSDCAALTCNGEPRCNDDGKCDPGLPCANPDPDHCSVSCVGDGNKASCEVVGLDQDADGHLDAVCASGGGDDCDDKSPTTYSGAAEQCDGADNDCDGKVDAEDGLALTGTPQLLHEITGTASVGIAAAPEGFGVLELQTRMQLYAATAANLLWIDNELTKAFPLPLPGTFVGQPSIARTGGEFFVYETGDFSVAEASLIHLPFGGNAVTASKVDRPNASSMAFGSPTNTPFSPPTGAVYTTHPDSAGWSSLCMTGIVAGSSLSCGELYGVAAPQTLHDPAMSPGAYAWVQASGPLGKDHDLTVFFTTRDAQTNELRSPSILQALKVKGDGTLATALRFHALRPQVITASTDYLVGWLSDAGLQFARFDQAGKERCRSAPAAGILSWAWTNSMVSVQRLGEALRKETYAAVVTREGTPAIVQIDMNCGVGGPIPLAADGAKVALGEGLMNGKPHLEVGHPVIATFQNGRIGAAWVEEPKTNGLYRVMFRSFGDKLCN